VAGTTYVYLSVHHSDKAPPLSAPHGDGWQWEYVRDLNVTEWRTRFNRYSARNTPDIATYILASATGWALHKETEVNRDATRLRSESTTARPLVVGSVLSQFAYCHATARTGFVAADHLGPVQ
jgi:hypothetical protein